MQGTPLQGTPANCRAHDCTQYGERLEGRKGYARARAASRRRDLCSPGTSARPHARTPARPHAMATEPPCLQLLDAVYTYRSASRSRGNRDNVCWERPQPVSVNPITMDRRTRVRHHACTLVRLHACPLAHLPTYELFLQRSDLPRLAASLVSGKCPS